MFKKYFENQSFKPSRLIWFGPKESLSELSSSSEENPDLKEKIQASRSQLIIFLDNWKPYELGGWRNNNEILANALGIENTKEAISSIQSLVGIKNPDGKIGPSSAYAISKYLNLKMRPSHFPRSTRESLNEAKNKLEEEIAKNVDYMKSVPDKMYLYFVDAMNSHLGEDDPSYGPDKEVFVRNLEHVIDHTRGHIDVHSLEGWYEAFLSSGLTKQEMDQLSLNEAMSKYKSSQASEVAHENSPLENDDSFSPFVEYDHPNVIDDASPQESVLENEDTVIASNETLSTDPDEDLATYPDEASSV